MKNKGLGHKTTQHDCIIAALFEKSGDYKHAMKPDRWLAVIQYDLHKKSGFYPAIHQLRYALKKLSKSGEVIEYYHERGWYKYYTYKFNPDRLPF